MKYEVTFTGKVIIDSDHFDGLGEAQMSTAYAIASECYKAGETGYVNPCTVYHKLHLCVDMDSFKEIDTAT